MNTKAKMPKGFRLKGPFEVPKAGDFSKWSSSFRDKWVEIPSTQTNLISLPLSTIRVRVGQPELQVCTLQ